MDQGSQRRGVRANPDRYVVIRIDRARKRFGQHFLVDQTVIERIHAALALDFEDSVIEIGPGKGALTYGLAQSIRNLTLIELDRDLATHLSKQFPEAKLLSQDVLTVPLDLFAKSRVVGNLPYNISTPLLVRLFEQPCIRDMHFMLQREVGQRLCAVPGNKDWGRLSVVSQYRWRIDPILDVPSSSFQPMPQVESMFLRFLPYQIEPEAEDLEIFHSVVRRAFSKRRKTISNSLSEFDIPWHEMTIDKQLRADHLSVQNFVELANVVAGR